MKIFIDSIWTLHVTFKNTLKPRKLLTIITNNKFAIEFLSIKLILFINSFFTEKSVMYPRILNLNDPPFKKFITFLYNRGGETISDGWLILRYSLKITRSFGLKFSVLIILSIIDCYIWTLFKILKIRKFVIVRKIILY